MRLEDIQLHASETEWKAKKITLTETRISTEDDKKPQSVHENS